MAKKTLKQEIAAFIRAQAENASNEQKAKDCRQAAEAEANRAEAADAVGSIPRLLRESLEAGQHLTFLVVYRDTSVRGELKDNVPPSVCGYCIELLAAEGLGPHLYIDLDCSGDWACRNSLCIRLEG